ncbi:hypothetical protein [Microlunatus soli]|uniref:Uncharacterized protein n=1 Tax=Microlunatus soli TaxID=630515 RepID=A0A1H1T5M6_9ACTN|nr:hypothetical protein [Microlunatus soli]SDS55464.1 hypothetical protein SAMN04489812_2262 [Microlunatus soli]
MATFPPVVSLLSWNRPAEDDHENDSVSQQDHEQWKVAVTIAAAS